MRGWRPQSCLLPGHLNDFRLTGRVLVFIKLLNYLKGIVVTTKNSLNSANIMQPPIFIIILEMFLLEDNNKINYHSLFHISLGHFYTAGQQTQSVKKCHSQSCHKMIWESQTYRLIWRLICMTFPCPSPLEAPSQKLTPGWDDLSRTFFYILKH